MILKQIDERTYSIQGQGVIAAVTADDPYRWARLFAGAQALLDACEKLLEEIEEIVVEIGYEPDGFPCILAAREAIAAAERGGG